MLEEEVCLLNLSSTFHRHCNCFYVFIQDSTEYGIWRRSPHLAEQLLDLEISSCNGFSSSWSHTWISTHDQTHFFYFGQLESLSCMR